MTHDDVPNDVRDFVLRYIDSVTQLEILLLLFSEPGREWSAAVISNRLRNNEPPITELLERLRSQKLIVMHGVAGTNLYRFLFEDAALTAMVHAVAESYRLRRARVIEIIFYRGA